MSIGRFQLMLDLARLKDRGPWPYRIQIRTRVFRYLDLYLSFSVRASRRGLSVGSLVSQGWHLRKIFAVARKQCLCPPKADCVRCGLSRAWVLIACLSFAAILPVSLRSQAPANISAAHSVDANKMYRAGVALAEQGKLDEAITTFEKALKSDRQNPLLLDAAGAAYSLKGDFEQAKQYFLECLDVDSGFVPARKNLGITYFITGQYDLAAAEFLKLQNISSTSHAVGNLFLGMIAEKNADYVQAVQLLEQSGALLDRYPEAILSLAQAEFQLKHLHRAQVALSNFDAAHGITASQ